MLCHIRMLKFLWTETSALKRFFPDLDDRKNVIMEFGLLSGIAAYDDDNMDDR